VTLGELWLVIERARVSLDLRVVYYSGRFGSPASRATIYNGEDVVINVPLGDIPENKIVFIWDSSYSGVNALREASPTAGKILTVLLDKGFIRATPEVNVIRSRAKNPERFVFVDNERNEVFSAADRHEIREKVYEQVQRDRGLIPI
jgi:hypothetical protein